MTSRTGDKLEDRTLTVERGDDVPRSRTVDRLEGRTVGDFVVGDKIGEGGFGVVFRAHQTLLDRPAVIKVLHTRHRATSTTTERFLREARLASRLDHPYAAHIYAFGAEPDGMLWIAMELVRGTSLSEYLRAHGPLTLEQLVPLLERICEVVHTAHEQGIIHRDLKPANVMVMARAGRLLPKLLDFGIAKSLVDHPDAGEPATAEGALAGDLTRRGATLGSPHYMAPEQWEDAANVTPRSDLYALGVLAFEALTGAPPFRGATTLALEHAHLRAPVPELPSPSPRALDRLFARALAKRPEDRFASALDMAAAFRDAAGLTGEKRPVPQLDVELREDYLARAPQPLAEAVAALEGARDARQARDASWVIASVLARWIGIVALAARSRTGGTHDGPGVLEAVRELGTSMPTDDDWLALARALLRAHADQPDLHPIPELVLFACEPGDRPGEGLRLFRELGALRAGLADPTATDDELIARLRPAIVLVSALLRRASFVCSYPLVVPRAEGDPELWIGARRARRPRIVTRGAAAEGQAILVDAAGGAVLALHPLVQIAEPAPGVAPELFLYAGRTPRGARLTAPPSLFELHDPQAIDWLRTQLATTFDEVAVAGARARPPYLGLAAFTAEDAALYFGREGAVDAFVNRLRVQPLVTVAGPSGAGKSSFVQAGVIPALAGWRAIVMRPGPAPLVALASRLQAAASHAPELAARVVAEPARLGELLRDDAAARGPVLLVVDQLEELFTLTRDDAERRAFAAAIASAARAPDDDVRVVVTLRDDFLVAAQALPGLRDRLAQGLHLLTTPDRGELQRMLVEPARRAGYAFEDPALPARMVDEVADRPGALALLSFTAARMWEYRDRHFRRLPTTAYERLGGVGGALARHAEALLEGMAAHAQRLVREAFRHLVTAEGTRAVLTRRELTAVLGAEAAAGGVIEQLVASRLLVAREGEADDQIEIAHEALIAAWPRLVEWRREDLEGARLRDQLRTAARQWDARGRPRGLLWRAEALAEYRRWRARYPGALTEIEDAFGRASVADAARGRRIRRAVVASAFAVLAAGLVMLSSLRQRAEVARARVLDQLVQTYEDQGRRALLDGDGTTALLYLNQAFQMGSDSPALRFMLARALEPFDAELATLEGHAGQLWSATFSADGARVLTAGNDGSVRIWDAVTGAAQRRLEGHVHGRTAAAWSPDGRLVATVDLDGHVRLWGAATGDLHRTLAPAGVESRPQVRFSRDGRLVVATRGAALAVWNVADGRLVTQTDVGTGRAPFADFDARARRVVGTSFDGVVVLLELETSRRIELHGHAAAVLFARFSPDDARLVTPSNDGTARIWDPSTGEALLVLRGHDNHVTDAAFSPDGRLVATASADRTARIWDAGTGELQLSLRGHGAQINRVMFTPDGRHVVTVAGDGSARIWDARRGTAIDALPHGASASSFVYEGALTADGKRLVTASWDGTAKLWSLEGGPRLAHWDEPRPAAKSSKQPMNLGRVEDTLLVVGEPTVLAVDLSTGRIRPVPSDGAHVRASVGHRTLAITSGRERIRLFGLRGDSIELLRELRAHRIDELALDPSDRFLATCDQDGEVALWAAETGARLRRRSLRGGGAEACTVSFSPDGQHLFVGYDGPAHEALILTVATFEPRAVLHLDGAVVRVEFAPDNRHLVVAASNVAQVWTLDGTRVARASHDATVLSVGWSPDSTRFATGAMNGMVSVTAIDGVTTARFRAHENYVLSSVFSPDGALVMTAGGDANVAIWDPARSRLVYRVSSPPRARAIFDPSGSRALVAGPHHLDFWRLAPRPVTREALEELIRCRVRLILRDGQPARMEDRGRCPGADRPR